MNAIILKKNIISLVSPFITYDNNVYSRKLNLIEHNLSNDLKYDNKSFLKIFKKKQKKYNSFLKSRHIINKNITGYSVIIKEIDKLFNLI